MTSLMIFVILTLTFFGAAAIALVISLVAMSQAQLDKYKDKTTADYLTPGLIN